MNNLNYKINILLTFSFLMLFFITCTINHGYYISNHSQEDIEVLFIEKLQNDTLEKLILEPETKFFLINSSGGIPWHYNGDTTNYGYKLTITQGGKTYNKDYSNDELWGSGKIKNSIVLRIRDEDF